MRLFRKLTLACASLLIPMAGAFAQLDRGVAVRADNGGALKAMETWDAFFASCMTRGARYGGDQNATTAMDKQIVEVVRARLVQ